MEPALNVLDHALHGDPGALSILEKTASIYILDATNSQAPTTYGCWDFLNQALNEVERYEQSHKYHSDNSTVVSLESHVQLLCTMSRKAARRSPSSDRRLIGICLSNAGVAVQYHTSCQSQTLIDLNCQTRERVMGRIAAMAFDFAFHKRPMHYQHQQQQQQQHHHTSQHSQFHSAFSNPVAIEGLCAVIAANTISNGPASVHDFAMDWIIPSASNLPPLAVISVIYHLAIESTGNTAPAGTEEALCKLAPPLISEVIGPLLIDSLRESETNENEGNEEQWNKDPSNTTRSQRLATLSMRALERWCFTTSMSITDLNQICTGTKVNIAEVISDSLYSHTESIIDAAAELLDTLLIASKTSSSQNNSLDHPQNPDTNDKEMDALLTELITAVGFQTLRFTERQSRGDTAVCRCLARIATTLALAAQSTLRANGIQNSFSGIVNLLLKATAHPSVHVCGIALEALTSLIFTGHSLSEHLLPILQQKAVYPLNVVEAPQEAAHPMDVDDHHFDFQEFNQFREDCLAETLVKCYLNNKIFYLESCAIAMESLCVLSPPPSLSDVYQLEAVLFCLQAVSIEATQNASLMMNTATNNTNPLPQAAASYDDARRHDEILVRCVASLTNAPNCPVSNPLILSQMCQFIGKYATWFAKTQTPGVLDSGAELALMSFKLACSAFHDDASAVNIMKQMQVSPFAQAATALRNILCRAPSHFATPQVLAALAGGWETSYVSANSDERLSVDDRDALCSGICRVLASLPADQWVVSLNALSRPTIDSLEVVIKKADDLLAENASMNDINNLTLPSILKRGADEIRLLSTMTRTFNNVKLGSTQTMKNGCGTDDDSVPNHPSLCLLGSSWPCLSYLAEKYSSHHIINEALAEFLTSSLSFQQDDGGDLSMLVELCDMASNVLSILSKLQQQDAGVLSPMLQFVTKVIQVYGEEAEMTDREDQVTRYPRKEKTRQIVKQILILSIEVVSSGLEHLWLEEGNNEQQHRGQNSIESSSSSGGGGSGSPVEKSQVMNKHKSLESLAALYCVLTACVEKCPILLVYLKRDTDDETFFHRAISVAMSTMDAKELHISRASMQFLKSIVDLRPSRQVIQESHPPLKEHVKLSETGNMIIGTKIDEIIVRIRSDLIQKLMNGAMGIFLRESLDSAASLLYSILTSTEPRDVDIILNAFLRRDQQSCLLGEDAIHVTLQVLGECTNGTKPSTYLMDFFSDLWDLYQTDDVGGIAGGNVVKKFERKYSKR